MLMKQFKALAKFTDSLKEQVMGASDAQAHQNGKMQQAMSDEQLAQMKMERDQARKDAQLQADLGRKERKLRLDLEAKSAKTTQAIESSQMKDNLKVVESIRANAEED